LVTPHQQLTTAAVVVQRPSRALRTHSNCAAYLHFRCQYLLDQPTHTPWFCSSQNATPPAGVRNAHSELCGAHILQRLALVEPSQKHSADIVPYGLQCLSTSFTANTAVSMLPCNMPVHTQGGAPLQHHTRQWLRHCARWPLFLPRPKCNPIQL
jgi:hypothetical protein